MCLSILLCLHNILRWSGCLGGSVGWASNFGSGHGFKFMSLSPVSGSVLTAQSLELASNSVSPSLSAPPPLALSLSLSLCLSVSLSKPRHPYVFKFIYLFWERQRHCEWGRDRERERETPMQALHCQHRDWCRAWTQKSMRSWPELKSRVIHSTDWATQSPQLNYLLEGPISKYIFRFWEVRTSTYEFWGDIIHPITSREDPLGARVFVTLECLWKIPN